MNREAKINIINNINLITDFNFYSYLTYILVFVFH